MCCGTSLASPQGGQRKVSAGWRIACSAIEAAVDMLDEAAADFGVAGSLFQRSGRRSRNSCIRPMSTSAPAMGDISARCRHADRCRHCAGAPDLLGVDQAHHRAPGQQRRVGACGVHFMQAEARRRPLRLCRPNQVRHQRPRGASLKFLRGVLDNVMLGADKPFATVSTIRRHARCVAGGAGVKTTIEETGPPLLRSAGAPPESRR